MSDKWKLVYQNKILKIHNEEGKDLSYNPNSGIQILVVDDYAFKDLNRNGKLDPFEDWRLPLRERIEDFSKRYHLSQKNDVIYYEKGSFKLPENLIRSMQETQVEEFTKENSMLATLLLMFDHDNDQYTSDYVIELFLQSLEMGMLDKVFYTIKKAVLSYLQGNERHMQLTLEI